MRVRTEFAETSVFGNAFDLARVSRPWQFGFLAQITRAEFGRVRLTIAQVHLMRVKMTYV